MNTVAAFEDLPHWFVASLNEEAETVSQGVRFVGNGHILVAVDGASFSFESIATKLFSIEVVVSPRAQMEPRAPAIDLSHDLLGVDAYDVQLGEEILIAIKYFGLVVSLFPNATWWGTGPTNPVVARVGNDLVAIVMPVRPV